MLIPQGPKDMMDIYSLKILEFHRTLIGFHLVISLNSYCLKVKLVKPDDERLLGAANLFKRDSHISPLGNGR